MTASRVTVSTLIAVIFVMRASAGVVLRQRSTIEPVDGKARVTCMLSVARWSMLTELTSGSNRNSAMSVLPPPASSVQVVVQSAPLPFGSTIVLAEIA